MWSNAQKNLLSNFCKSNGSTDLLEQLTEHGRLRCDDIQFTLLPVVDDDSSLRVFVEFGEPPPEQLLEIYKRLLEINLLMPHQGFERLGMDPQSGAVIFSYRLSSPTAEELLASLHDKACHARAWQLSYFLDDEPEAVLVAGGTAA